MVGDNSHGVKAIQAEKNSQTAPKAVPGFFCFLHIRKFFHCLLEEIESLQIVVLVDKLNKSKKLQSGFH